jgi:hypothetical protein
MPHVMLASLVACIAVAGSTMAFAGQAKSLDYDLEYGNINAGSASTQSADYSNVSTITLDGVAGQSASSASYSVAPAVGGISSPATVPDWSLY